MAFLPDGIADRRQDPLDMKSMLSEEEVAVQYVVIAATGTAP